MKKLALLTLVVLLFGACTSNDPVETYTQSYTVYAGDWLVGTDDDSGDYLYYEFREPALTTYVYEHAILNAYLEVNGGLSPLPFDDFWNERTGQWTEQVTCEFRPDYITFICKASDHGLDPYYDYNFVVKFMW
jgi:hypothetical protein